jgi:hypothetical protein
MLAKISLIFTVCIDQLCKVGRKSILRR